MWGEKVFTFFCLKAAQFLVVCDSDGAWRYGWNTMMIIMMIKSHFEFICTQCRAWNKDIIASIWICFESLNVHCDSCLVCIDFAHIFQLLENYMISVSLTARRSRIEHSKLCAPTNLQSGYLCHRRAFILIFLCHVVCCSICDVAFAPFLRDCGCMIFAILFFSKYLSELYYKSDGILGVCECESFDVCSSNCGTNGFIADIHTFVVYSSIFKTDVSEP